jgi:hypothetical protein
MASPFPLRQCAFDAEPPGQLVVSVMQFREANTIWTSSA